MELQKKHHQVQHVATLYANRALFTTITLLDNKQIPVKIYWIRADFILYNQNLFYSSDLSTVWIFT